MGNPWGWRNGKSDTFGFKRASKRKPFPYPNVHGLVKDTTEERSRPSALRLYADFPRADSGKFANIHNRRSASPKERRRCRPARCPNCFPVVLSMTVLSDASEPSFSRSCSAMRLDVVLAAPGVAPASRAARAGIVAVARPAASAAAGAAVPMARGVVFALDDDTVVVAVVAVDEEREELGGSR